MHRYNTTGPTEQDCEDYGYYMERSIMTDKFIPQNGFIILKSTSSQSSIELPDSAKEIGAPSGEVLYPHNDYPEFHEKAILFYDGSKAYRIKTSQGEYVAVKGEDVISILADEEEPVQEK